MAFPANFVTNETTARETTENVVAKLFYEPSIFLEILKEELEPVILMNSSNEKTLNNINFCPLRSVKTL